MNRVACAALAAVALLAGCASQRPLFRVEKDGDYHLKTEQYAKAATDFQEYVTRKPDNVEVRYKLAKAQTLSGQARQAVENLAVCTEVDPLNDRYLDAQAEALYAAGERDALVGILARAASERGRVADYLRLGVFANRLGNIDEAQQALLTAAKIDQGRSWQVQMTLADFYGSTGDRAKQVRRVRMAYYIQPENVAICDEARRLGEVPGPTFGVMPEEARLVIVPESK